MSDYLEDDGGPQVIAVEDGGEPQALWVRVPGIWIEYQERHRGSALAGPVLLSPDTWRKLNKAVEERLRRHRPGSPGMRFAKLFPFGQSTLCRRLRSVTRISLVGSLGSSAKVAPAATTVAASRAMLAFQALRSLLRRRLRSALPSLAHVLARFRRLRDTS